MCAAKGLGDATAAIIASLAKKLGELIATFIAGDDIKGKLNDSARDLVADRYGQLVATDWGTPCYDSCKYLVGKK